MSLDFTTFSGDLRDDRETPTRTATTHEHDKHRDLIQEEWSEIENLQTKMKDHLLIDLASQSLRQMTTERAALQNSRRRMWRSYSHG